MLIYILCVDYIAMTQEYLRRRRKQVTEVAHELVDHDAGDAHLGSTAVVQLDGALVLLPFVGLLVPAEVEAVAVVAGEFAFASGIDHDAEFHTEDGKERKREDSSHFRRDVGKVKGLEAGTDALHARKTGPCESRNVSRESQHRNAAGGMNEMFLGNCGEI